MFQNGYTGRVWGEGEILNDDFYDECDRRGILLWQDFYMGWGMYNEEDSQLPIFESEAVELVRRLKHHPSILLWCGGNENYWSRDWIYPNEYCYGEKIIGEIYPEVVRKYDPERYYHVNSPAGGDFANDPLGGDTHGYTHIWYVPGRLYPEFLSENCRVSAPELKTMKRMMTEEELWPKDYVNTFTKRNPLSWPSTWSDHNTNAGHIKLGPVEHYMDAESPEELIYRLGEAHCEYLKGQIEGFRRGKPLDDPIGRRRCNGHIVWKFNNNSNIISYGIVDYFNEPLRAYYELKRLYEPFQVSFSIEDKISVWAVNDTLEDVSGKLVIKRINLEDSSVADTKTVYFTCERDDSVIAASLNSFGQFLKNSVLVATAYTLDGKVIAQNMAVPQPERWMTFPSAGKLKASVEGNVLTISSDVFARSVSLEGDEEGDTFGWQFEDNFFNLIPGEEKKVRFFGTHKKGKIRIQPYYWSHEDGIEIEI